jgi:hypothetical protein
MSQYTVNKRYWFIRLISEIQSAVISNDLLTPDVDQLAWLNDLECIEIVNLLCYNREDEKEHYYFQAPRQGYWSSASQPVGDALDWRIVEGGTDPRIFTALAPVQEYVTKIIANVGREYSEEIVEKAQQFQNKLGELHACQRGMIDNYEPWTVNAVSLVKRRELTPIEPMIFEDDAMRRIRAHYKQGAEKQ